jgi:hypothetical protein
VTVLKDATVVARKQHRCDLCDGIIEKGEKYQYSNVIYEDEGFSVSHIHSHCIELNDRLDLSLMDFEEAVYAYCSEHGIAKRPFPELVKIVLEATK